MIFLALTAVFAAGDLLSKHYVFESLLNDPSIARRIEVLAPGRAERDLRSDAVLGHLHIQRRVAPGLCFTLSTNPGVVFGRTEIPRWGVLLATAATIVMVLFFFATCDLSARWLHVALSCILAGAAGNLYDRLFGEVKLPGLEPIRHQVRDFIDLSSIKLQAAGWTINYPYIFNIADVLLVVGVGLLIVHWLVDRSRERAKSSGH